MDDVKDGVLVKASAERQLVRQLARDSQPASAGRYRMRLIYLGQPLPAKAYGLKGARVYGRQAGSRWPLTATPGNTERCVWIGGAEAASRLDAIDSSLPGLHARAGTLNDVLPLSDTPAIPRGNS